MRAKHDSYPQKYYAEIRLVPSARGASLPTSVQEGNFGVDFQGDPRGYTHIEFTRQGV